MAEEIRVHLIQRHDNWSFRYQDLDQLDDDGRPKIRERGAQLALRFSYRFAR